MGALCTGEKDGQVVKLASGAKITVLTAIAEGGFSTVYKARDEERQEVAVKQIICQESEMVAAARKEVEVPMSRKKKNNPHPTP